MINNKNVGVILSAHYAAKTLEITYSEIDFSIKHMVFFIDDKCKDYSLKEARITGIKHILK